MTTQPDAARTARAPWIDVARGVCIILVVMMHSALGVEKVTGQVGWLHAVVAWTKPFRMPDFFMLSGFLATGAIAPWRKFLDRKVLHFVYFYCLWLFIISISKAILEQNLDLSQLGRSVLFGLFEPAGTLWFIYILPFFYVVARFAVGPRCIPILVAATGLHIVAAMYPDGGRYAMASSLTISTAIDSFALFLVYFLIGFATREYIAKFVEAAGWQRSETLLALCAWATVHTAGYTLGITEIPGATILFGIAGALAIMAFSRLFAESQLAPFLAYCGQNSLVIYLTFVIPMNATRSLIISLNLIQDPGWRGFWTMTSAIIVSLAIGWAVNGTAFRFLYQRPQWAHLPKTGTP